MKELVYVNGEEEHVISSGIKAEPAEMSEELVFREPKLAIAEEQASLLVQMAQSSPLKPDVHWDVPTQPLLVALLESVVRFA